VALEGSELVLGIDGGGSQTRAWLARLDGSVIGCGQAGASNVFHLGVDGASRAIAEAATTAWQAAGLAPGVPAAVFAGVAGAGAEADQQVLAGALAIRLQCDAQRCRVDHDMRIALEGAFAGAPGAVLVAGTGSVCYGRLSDGRAWRAGGLGPLLDDGGSGYWLGMQALRQVVRVADGRATTSSLVDAIAARLGLREPRDALRFVRSAGDDRARIAALAPIVLAAAAADDAAAGEIVMRGADELATMAEAVLHRLGLDRPGFAHLAGTGSLLEKNAYYRRIVSAAVARRVPAARLKRPALPACAGAVLLGFRIVGLSAGPDVLRRLKTKAAAEAAAR
jgi:glucosamine kinase